MNNARMTVQTLEKDSNMRFQVRRMLTGLAWSVFGIGGLCLSLTYFPWLNITEKYKDIRVRKARKMISKSFNLFFTFTRLTGVMNREIEGIDELRKVKGTVIVANHPTILDYVLIASRLPEVDCLVKADLTHNFFLKGVVRAADYLLNDASESLVEECRRRLGAGENILIFPEGTRTIPGKPLKLHRGVAHIALRCNAPIETIRIHCSHRWLDKSSEWYEIPPSKPTITVKRSETLKSSDFINPLEDGYSLAARRLTKKLAEVLSS